MATVMWDRCHGDKVTFTYHSPAHLRHLGKFMWFSSHTENRKKNQVKLILTYFIQPNKSKILSFQCINNIAILMRNFTFSL